MVARIGIAGVVGGAVGNLIDRATAGYVLDFVDVYWNGWHFWAFNVADAAITLGVGCMILDILGLGAPCIQFCLSLGPLTIYTYGVLLAAAYLVGLGSGGARAPTPRAGCATACSTSASGSSSRPWSAPRLLLFIVDFEHFTSSWTEFMSLLRSGGVFYGGLIAAVVVVHLPAAASTSCRCGRPATCSRPGIALGYMVGRLGCLAAGCCYGRPTDVAWAITFTDPAAAVNVGTPLNVPLHPTQLYEAAAGLVIFLLLMAFERRGRTFPGRTFWMLRAALRGLALHHRVLPRRRPRPGVRHGLDVAVHLARAGAAQPVHAVVSRAARRSSPARPEHAARPAKAAFRVTHLNVRRPVTRLRPASALDRFLAGEVPNYSRSQIQRLIDDGQVVVARVKVTKANVQLREGDEIAVTLPDTVAATPAAPRTCRSRSCSTTRIWSSSTSRPAWWCIPRPGTPDGTLVNALLHHVQGPERHRRRAAARASCIGSTRARAA